MKLICDCGEVTNFFDSKDGATYNEYEGWYKVADGLIETHGEHDSVFFNCKKCGEKIWIFT